MILAVVFGVAAIILAAYLISLQKQLRSINNQLSIRLAENKLQPLSIELINNDLNNLTSNINRILKKEEEWEIQRTIEEKNFKEMIANISHDLRTPLTAIKGYQQLIGSEYLSEKQKEKLMIAEKHTDDLTLLINHFFEYSYALNAERNLRYEKVEISQLVAECIAGHASMFEDRGISVNFEMDSFAYAHIDKEAGMRVVQNLVKNAAQYCRVCIRQYQKNTQEPALQGRNESTDRRVRTLFLYIPIKLQSAHWFFLKIFCRMKAPKSTGGFCDEKYL